MSARAAIHACSMVLAHAPDLVRHGSKPTRELAADSDGLLASLSGALRTYDEALAYPPNQVLIGNLRPEALWEVERPWWRHPVEPRDEGPFGVIVDQAELYRRMQEADRFGLFKLDGAPAGNGALTLHEEGREIGSMAGAHDVDESLSAAVLLENLACKATGALALEHVLRLSGLAPEEIEYVIGSGEEAVGDRYQRGGGNLAKAMAEQAGCVNASGSDVKAFCCAPVHALVVAGSLVAAGVYPHVVVVAGGSLAKLGMKFAGALRNGAPVLEDVLAGFAVVVGPPGNGAPEIRLDAVGRHRVGSGSAQQAVLEDLVVEPLERLGQAHPRRRPLRDRAPRSGDHRAGRGGQRPQPQLQAHRRTRRPPRRARARGAGRLRARPRPARLLADARARGLRRPVASSRAGGAAGRRDRLDHAAREGLALPRAHDGARRRPINPLGTGKGVDMPVEATVETYHDLTSDGSVLVDFWGPRCQPCLAMMPTIAKLEEEAGGAVRVVKVNSAENRDICRELRVFGLPTYVLMQNGEELERLSGEVSKSDIERAFATLAKGGEAA